MGSKSDLIVEELGYKPAKTKTPQKSTPNVVQGRDLFQTPNYAVDLLVPFIPKNIKEIWEPAAGEGRIVRRLEATYKVIKSDIRSNSPKLKQLNFLTEVLPVQPKCIITNPPFSLKEEFYNRCLDYHVPFALLIPAEYNLWIIEAIQNGAEKIVPTRRIDFLTPNVVARVNAGESTDYKSIDEIPQHLLYSYSSSDFHSMWLTHGFNLGKTETFVELTLKQKKENI